MVTLILLLTTVYTTEEKIQMVLLYLDKHMSLCQKVRNYDLANHNIIGRLVKQYKETGPIIETKIYFS